MLEEVKKIIHSAMNYDCSLSECLEDEGCEECAIRRICQLFKPKFNNAKLTFSDLQTFFKCHSDTEIIKFFKEQYDVSFELKPETDYNIGDKGKTTGNISYGTMPKPDEVEAKAIDCITECIHYESCIPFVNPVGCTGKQSKLGEIKSMDEYYKKYLPEYDKKYPIDMRVSKEEQILILSRRGGYCERKSKA